VPHDQVPSCARYSAKQSRLLCQLFGWCLLRRDTVLVHHQVVRMVRKLRLGDTRGRLGRREELPGGDLLVAKALVDLAEVVSDQNTKKDYEDALGHLMDALGIQQGALGPEHPAIAQTFADMGVRCPS
jgi:hypothetical protein